MPPRTGSAALVVAPAGLGEVVDGEVRVEDVTVAVSEPQGVAADRFDPEGSVLDQVVHQGAVVGGAVVAV